MGRRHRKVQIVAAVLVAPAVQPLPPDLPEKEALPALVGPQVAGELRCIPPLLLPRRRRGKLGEVVEDEPEVGGRPGDAVALDGWRGARQGEPRGRGGAPMARDAPGLENRHHVAMPLHGDLVRRHRPHPRLVPRAEGEERRPPGEIGHREARLRRRGVLEVDRRLAVGMAAAAVVARLARAHLMPGLRHVEHQTAAVEGLEGHRRVRRNARQEAGVVLLAPIRPRHPRRPRLAHRDLAQDAQPLAPHRVEVAAVVRIGPVGRRRKREHPHGPDVAVAVNARVRPLPQPAERRLVPGVERIAVVPKAAEGRFRVAPEERGGADQTERLARGEPLLRDRLVAQLGPRRRPGDAIELLPAHHRPRPLQVVAVLGDHGDEARRLPGRPGGGHGDRPAVRDQHDGAMHPGERGAQADIDAIVIRRAGGIDRQQVRPRRIARRAGRRRRMRELAPPGRAGTGGRPLDPRRAIGVVLPARARRRKIVRRGERGEPDLLDPLEGDLAVEAVREHRLRAVEIGPRRIERVADQVAESVVVQVVIPGHHQIAARHLGHEMVHEKRLGKPGKPMPVAPVGSDHPERKLADVAQPLLLPARKSDPSIEQHLRMQRHREIQMADRLDVAAVVVHGEQLHHPLAGVERLRRHEVVAAGGEDDPSSGRPGAAGVEDADPRMVAPRHTRLEPRAVAGVGRQRLGGEPHQRPRRQIQLVEIRPRRGQRRPFRIAALRVDRGQVVVPGEQHLPAVERHVRIGHRSGREGLARRRIDLSAIALQGKDHFARAVALQQHELRPRIRRQRTHRIRPHTVGLSRSRPCIGSPHIEQLIGQRLHRIRPRSPRREKPPAEHEQGAPAHRPSLRSRDHPATTRGAAGARGGRSAPRPCCAGRARGPNPAADPARNRQTYREPGPAGEPYPASRPSCRARFH